jgi:hypothetical protein
MDPKLKALLTSRKLWAAIVGLVIILVKAFKPDFPLTAEQILPVILLLASYILGTAIEDTRLTTPGPATPKQVQDQLEKRSTFAQKQPK